MPKYYPINEEAARRAKNANSFSDYVPGSATAAYREMVDRAYTLGKQQKGRVDPMYHEKIDGLIDRYARKLAENINQCNLIDARVPSILIAGGSNFPVRKKEKQNAARDKNMGEYMQIEGLLDKVRSTGMGGISADDDRAVEKLEAKLAGLEAMQEEMKTVNAYYRKHKTLEGCPVLSAEEIGKLQSSMASDWRKNPVPYPSYLLTNNNANIRRTRQRIEDLKSQSEYAGWAFPGGRAEINEGENRLQLFFEEKPSEEQRRELKSNGFKWAPSQGAWQRQLKFKIELSSDAFVYLPEGQLKKAISNILSNAVNYTEAGQSISVVFDKNKLSVSNECSVLPPEQLQHIFEPFYRPDLAHSQATGGNGLGLYIVQTILDKLRLKYQFVPMPNDRGMSFTIQF